MTREFAAPLPHACRPGCGACCIAPSISSAAPGMANGKPAGQACIHLIGDDYRCALFGQSTRPGCCSGLQPSPEMCGETREYALQWLAELEQATAPLAGKA